MIHAHLSLLWLLQGTPVDSWTPVWDEAEAERIHQTLQTKIWSLLDCPRMGTVEEGCMHLNQTFRRVQQTSTQPKETYSVQLPAEMYNKESMIFLDPTQPKTDTVSIYLDEDKSNIRLNIEVETRTEVGIRGYVLVRTHPDKWSWIPFRLTVKHTSSPSTRENVLEAAKRLLQRPFVEEFTNYGVAPMVPSMVYFPNSKFRSGVFDTIFRTLAQSGTLIAHLGQCLFSEWKAHREHIRERVLFQVPGTLDASTDLWTLEIPERFCRKVRIGERVSARCFENELWLYVGFIHRVGVSSIQVSFSGLSFTTTRTFPLLQFHLDARPYYFMGMALTKAARLAWVWERPEKRFELVHGPSYSGKTRTLAREVVNIIGVPNTQVLVLAPTEASADRITLRIVQELDCTSPDTLLRLPEWDRDPRNVHPDVLGFTVRDTNGYFTVHTSRNRRIWVMTPAMSRVFERLPQHSIQFTHVVVDDATRMTEPELLIPLTMFCTKHASRILLSGDLLQPGPQLYTQHPKYQLRSLFERLWKKHPGIKRYQHTVSYFTPPVLLELATEKQLIYNIYNMTFTTAFDSDYHRIRYPDIYALEPDAPLVVYGINGRAEQKINPQELELIQTFVTKFASQRIFLLSAHDAQTEQLRVSHSSNPFVRVGSLEELYDADIADIVIVSLVDESSDARSAFIRSPRTFYSLLTRTRGLLIVIGSPLLLHMDPNWRRLSAYANRNKKYRGIQLETTPFPEEPTHYEYERSLLPEGILQ
jgi:hypothetical protein